MSFAMEDSLESGWVSVRPNVFDEKEKHKFVFIVAWNDIEGKFAITCHNRTIQRRTAVRDSLVEAADNDLGSAMAVTEKRKMDKQKGSLNILTRDNITTTQSPSIETCVPRTSGESSLKGLNVTKSHMKEKKEIRLDRGHTKVRVTLPVDNTVVSDIEVLDPSTLMGETRYPADDVEGLEDFDNFVRQNFSWAGLFSFQDLKTIHLQLCAVNSDLEPCLPPLPEEHSGVWTVLFGVPELNEQETETLCYQLQIYLGHALDTCGWKILSQVLFTDGDTEEYYESLSELRQTGYEDALQRAKRRLHEVTLLNRRTISKHLGKKSSKGRVSS